MEDNFSNDEAGAAHANQGHLNPARTSRPLRRQCYRCGYSGWHNERWQVNMRYIQGKLRPWGFICADCIENEREMIHLAHQH